jgi:hypothetical protein
MLHNSRALRVRGQRHDKLDAQLPAAESCGDEANGRKRKGWKEEIPCGFEEASGDLKGVTDCAILD